MSLTFIKKQEDFICDHCHASVTGNGYTNHCPKCLWSKHVDVNPGDRASTCGGEMEPIEFLKEKSEYILVHKCVICGHEKRNKMSPEDDFDAAVKIVKKI